MPQRKYQIFVSSTFRDLAEERQDAIRNILDLKHIPAGMELFPAADIDQLEYIKKVIDECDYYILIVGGRYGSVDTEGVSFTEREYQYAVDTGKIVLAFVHKDPASIPVGKSDITAAIVEALNKFRDKVMTGRLVKAWTSRTELESLILKSLIHAFNDFPQIGWIRGNAAASEFVLEQSNRALQENAILKEQLEKLKAENAPKIYNIADLLDNFEVRYKTKWRSGGSFQYTDRTATLSWLRIFISVAALLGKSETDHVILFGLRNALMEAGIGYTPDTINEMDRARVKVQLVALGLIETYVSKTVQGGSAVFLKLTGIGRATFIENMVTRRNENDQSAN